MLLLLTDELELSNGEGDQITHLVWNFDVLNRLRTIHVALTASILIGEPAVHYCPVWVILVLIHNILHVFLVIHWAAEWIEVWTR